MKSKKIVKILAVVMLVAILLFSFAGCTSELSIIKKLIKEGYSVESLSDETIAELNDEMINSSKVKIYIKASKESTSESIEVVKFKDKESAESFYNKCRKFDSAMEEIYSDFDWVSKLDGKIVYHGSSSAMSIFLR